jgi:hypothetical protein
MFFCKLLVELFLEPHGTVTTSWRKPERRKASFGDNILHRTRNLESGWESAQFQ